ncbi:hypothetical protein SFA64_05255 [Escherichia coli]|nr:hypothetical protein [Escherichia coli]
MIVIGAQPGNAFLANVLLIKDNRVEVFIEANGKLPGTKIKTQRLRIIKAQGWD